MTRAERTAQLRRLLEERILVLDGGFGTMLQDRKLTETDYRGTRFADWKCDLKGNSDILVLTQPEIVADVHRKYLEAGSDIIETNTFTANYPSQADYHTEDLVAEINLTAAKIARRAADEFVAKNGGVRFVAGALGPTNRTASLSPNVNDPAYRAINFDQLAETYLISA